MSLALPVPGCGSDDSAPTENCTGQEGATCRRGRNLGTCTAGACQLACAGTDTCGCDSAFDCPVAEECRAWSCSAGACVEQAIRTGMPVASQNDGDCEVDVCASNGGTETVADDLDVPTDEACASYACADGDVVTTHRDPGTACPAGACDGAGVCGATSDKTNGEVCSNGDECASTLCIDGYCCGSSCRDECMSCAVDGLEGTCSPTPLFGSDSFFSGAMAVECNPANGFRCDGTGGCHLSGGVPCTNGTFCISGTCDASSNSCAWLEGEPCDSPTDCGPTLSCSSARCQ